ncbi:MAG: xanthine dehydrogenase family protein subunit M [Acidimicrobiales bacterium]|nr:xanthine dehydrogenase family protein subunit M [Acidimicrobiales bacterium]
MTSITIPTSLRDVLEALAGGARPIAGGTDLVVSSRQGKAPLPEALVAIDQVAELSEVKTGTDGLMIGAMVTHARLMTEELLVESYTAVADAAALVGSPSTRNVGTIGGNVMNGSPAMDTGAPLVVLGAEVELRSTSGSRRVSLADLWTGPGRTSAAPDELCVAVHLPLRPVRSGSAYVRLEYRRAMEIAVVGAAASVSLAEDGTIAAVAVALTAVAPTILAVPDLDALVGLDPTVAAQRVAPAASATATPISDLRASDTYRRHTIGVMATRAVEAAARRASGETIAVPVNRALGIGAAR